MNLSEEVSKLIAMHQEGPYWDFKKEWYRQDKDEDQLIDIICMANNLVDRNAYIIIGIDENDNYSVHDVRQDTNRRNTQQLTDFLRNKKFAGDFRPTVTVESVLLNDGCIDVITIQNSLNTPFYLKERYKGIGQSNIYVRIQDSNTPKDKTADFYNVEYLWKKRFGMLLSPIEKVKMYLMHPDDWEISPSQEEKEYYKYAPEFTIEYNFEREDGRGSYEYYFFSQIDPTPHWIDIKICYFQTVIADLDGAILDGGRYCTAIPYTDCIKLPRHLSCDVSYKYMVKGEINYLVHEFYYKYDRGEAKYAHDSFEKCILIFNNDDERTRFKEYVIEHWEEKEAFAKNIWIPYMREIPGYDMEFFKQQYRDVCILKKMLEEFRYTYNIYSSANL